MSVMCNVAYNDPYIYVVNLQLPLLLSTSVIMYPFLCFHDVPRYAHLHCILLEQYLILQLTLCVLINCTFVVDSGSLLDSEDTKCDDCGTWKQTKTATTYLRIHFFENA